MERAAFNVLKMALNVIRVLNYTYVHIWRKQKHACMQYLTPHLMTYSIYPDILIYLIAFAARQGVFNVFNDMDALANSF